jgi:hypothetical protein
MIRLAMAGALGRMGRTILSLALKDKDFRITGALEQAGRSEIGADIGPFLGVSPLGVEVSSDIETVLKRSDVHEFYRDGRSSVGRQENGDGLCVGNDSVARECFNEN